MFQGFFELRTINEMAVWGRHIVLMVIMFITRRNFVFGKIWNSENNFASKKFHLPFGPKFAIFWSTLSGHRNVIFNYFAFFTVTTYPRSFRGRSTAKRESVTWLNQLFEARSSYTSNELKNTVPVSKRIQHVSITKIDCLRLFKEIIAAQSED
jgi:hypothetical protein